VQRVLRWLVTGKPLSLAAAGQRMALVHPPSAVTYVDVNTEPSRNPIAHCFWHKQGFRLHHLEGNLQCMRLTRDDWLAGRTDTSGVLA
jgi:hypothetical protein